MEDNSILMEDSSMNGSAPRKSLSQPSLATADSTEKKRAIHRPVSGTLSNTAVSDVRNIPIIQTWQENEELKGKMYAMRCEVQMYVQKYNTAKDAMHKSVQEVLDEYVMLKLNAEEAEEKIAEFKSLNQELISVREQLADSQEKIRKSEEIMKKERDEFAKKIAELEEKLKPPRTSGFNLSTNDTLGSFRLPNTLDDALKRDDPDFTLIGPDEKKYMELEDKFYTLMEKNAELELLVRDLRDELDQKSARLAELDNQHAQLIAASGGGILNTTDSKTFVYGDGNESTKAAQIAYIDELEQKLKSSSENLERTTTALADYMNRVSKLEKEIRHMKKNTTFDSPSIRNELTPDELRDAIEKANSELNVLRKENRELRQKCSQLVGGDGNVSDSFGQSRLFAGISPAAAAADVHNVSLSHPAATPPADSSMNVNAPIFPSEAADDDSVMDMSSVRRMNEQDNANFAAALAEFDSIMKENKLNDTADTTGDISMPPPNRMTTESLLRAKSEKSTPERHGGHSRTSSAVTTMPVNDLAPRRSSVYMESKRTTVFSAELMHDVQQILDSSAALIDGAHGAAVDVQGMQEKMSLIRGALTRLFNRLKSSAALFEEILEKMGSSSPLAERIKQMQLAFETSICENAEVSQFLDAAEKELTNMSINFSMLEKSMVSQSFVADVTRRFSIAPAPDELLGSSLLNASYEPMFRIGRQSVAETEKEIEALRDEVKELRERLAKTNQLEMDAGLASPNTSMLQKHLADVQLRASQNFEELEMCQATLTRVENEKVQFERELKEANSKLRAAEIRLGETERELREAMSVVEEERRVRKAAESKIHKMESDLRNVERTAVERESSLKNEFETHLRESNERINHIEGELERAVDHVEKLQKEREMLSSKLTSVKNRADEAESTANGYLNEINNLMDEMKVMSDDLERLRAFEMEQTDLKKKLSAKKSTNYETYNRCSQTSEKENAVDETVAEAIENVGKELTSLTRKQMKIKIDIRDVNTIRLACEEMCKQLIKEKACRHEQAEAMREINAGLDVKLKEIEKNQENVDPNIVGSIVRNVPKEHYRDPTRQLLRDATSATDGIVQVLKKIGHAKDSDELREIVKKALTDARQLRDFLHQKIILLKTVDMASAHTETHEQLLQHLARSYQDFALVDEECKKLRKVIAKMQAAVMDPGFEVQERIKREIGRIARDMGAVASLQKTHETNRN
ncbi:unnamed protein product [Caenorhabditis bovis]|uniref:Uncharacterized protein n=1 Tax=Caenorhabditis bovis TaxID=2654633 RepID=A0A8S1ETD2_9PELO|nr:unnamed protein product [Caenorhabditis bovis]